jgi:DDE family transposase
VKGPSPRRLRKYVCGPLGLQKYLQSPGDGRRQPQIPAQVLIWALLLGQLLRQFSFLAIEALAGSAVRSAAGVHRSFGDDTLAYFTERLDPALTRVAMAATLRKAKRNKAFDGSRFIGLVVDGTGAGRRRAGGCKFCRPIHKKSQQVVGYHHKLVMISVAGTGLSLPVDVEPYGPGDSEYAAAQRLLRRAVANLGARFADYVVGDGEFATAPFLHTADELGLPVVARLKGNLPELLDAAQKRFRSQPAKLSFRHGQDRVEMWDADDFDPWEALRWSTVRVFFYRQHKRNGQVVEAFWLTNLSTSKAGTRLLFQLAKSRWEIENQGFNDAKNRYGMEHICHHHPNSMLTGWLLVALGLTIERLYRVRYLHRGTHPVRTAIELLRILWLHLAAPSTADTS